MSGWDTFTCDRLTDGHGLGNDNRKKSLNSMIHEQLPILLGMKSDLTLDNMTDRLVGCFRSCFHTEASRDQCA